MITIGQSRVMAQSAERSDSLKFTGRLLVTGGEGELGGVMGRLLHDNGVSVAVQCDSTKHRQDGLRTFPMPLLDPEFADRVRELQPEVILHCAGDARREGGSRSSYEAYCVTMDRVAALCEVVRKSAPRACVVLLSPDSATRGESPYARFARLTEDLLRECGAAFELKTTVMQCGQLFGAGLRSHVVYDILFRLHAASEGVAELPYAEAEQMELTQVFDLAAALKSLLSGEMPDVVRIEGTKIQASELTGMLARLTESRKPYEFSGRAEEIVRTTSGRLRVYPCLEQTELVEALKRFAEWWLGRR